MAKVTTKTANLVEVFSAIQGEGLNVGTRQIFIRFGGCDLRCHFCDSDRTWQVESQCYIEQTPGQRDFEVYDNPIAQQQLLTWIQQQHQPSLHDSISLTGGEPLLQAKFLQEFLPDLKQATQLPIYLETGGHRPQELSLIIDYLDAIGMDMKLPSVSGEKRWEAHQDFLSRCYSAEKEVFVKLIISDQTLWEDLAEATRIIREADVNIPVILQPATPILREAIAPPRAEQVLSWQQQMKESLRVVRVIPQTHQMIGQL